MIFVTLGSQKFQFNRILIEIDKLIEEKIITEDIFAQIGSCDYIPKNFKYKKFLDRDEFSSYMDNCDIVITHGGTGAIINALKKEKYVIAIPRLMKFNEHVDDHQIQIVNEFFKSNYIMTIFDIGELKNVLEKAKNFERKRYKANTKVILEEIKDFIDRG